MCSVQYVMYVYSVALVLMVVGMYCCISVAIVCVYYVVVAELLHMLSSFSLLLLCLHARTQRHRDTETHRHRDTETQRHRDTDT